MAIKHKCGGTIEFEIIPEGADVVGGEEVIATLTGKCLKCGGEVTAMSVGPIEVVVD